MTTEIAIMNKSAVALAADSAVTIPAVGPSANNCKVFNSANKLFALSKYAPVGLMIYGNATMLGIPWETIVKMYRASIRNKVFPSLAEYCDDFFMFLDRFDVSADLQEAYVVKAAADLFQDLRSALDRWVEEEIQSGRQVASTQVETKLRELVNSRYDAFVTSGRKSVLSDTERSELGEKYRDAVQAVAKRVFEKLPLDPPIESQLLAIAANAASIGPANQSGVVIAGFGTKDLYPRCQSHDVAGVLAGKTIKRDGKRHAITHTMGATIIPFAQSDEVQTFMEGIGPTLVRFLKGAFYGIMANGLPDRLRDEISSKLDLTDPQKQDVRDIAGEMCKGACDFAFKQLAEHQRKHYIAPVVTATGFLNKAELAAMAETLVNLVSFRKQVTMEAETVGGPIDVAIITKGDGFVWIKRKHYFPAELNHHFFSNYYRNGVAND